MDSPTELYKDFWEIIKYDLKELFDTFRRGQLELERLNHGVITMIPKVPYTLVIKKFRPIRFVKCYL